MTKAGTTPAGLASSGRRLWRSVMADYELDCHEELLLLEACRCADRLDALAGELTGSVLTTNGRGEVQAHPAVVEARAQSLTLARLLASLRLPTDDVAGRPQRRGASRAPYGIRSVS